MAARAKLKRKSYFVDERALKRAKSSWSKNRGGGNPIIQERVVEMEEFWEFMKIAPFSHAWQRGETLRWP